MNIEVIKVGGSEAENTDFLEAIFAYIQTSPHQCILIHGGGKEITRDLDQFGIESQFVAGQRVTCERSVGVVEKVLCGSANKRLVRFFNQKGIPSFGCSGSDLGILQAKRTPDLGRVGVPAKVNNEALRHILALNWMPILAPVAIDENFETLNVNADFAAGFVAQSLQAKRLTLFTAVEGVLANGQLLKKLNGFQAQELIDLGIADGGMIPKLQTALGAASTGIPTWIGSPFHFDSGTEVVHVDVH